MPNNRVVFKYPLTHTSPHLIDTEPVAKLPYGANVIMAGIQGGVLCVWAEVDPVQEPVEREFRLIPTGGSIPPDSDYLETFLLEDGQLVAHLYLRRANHSSTQVRHYHDLEPVRSITD